MFGQVIGSYIVVAFFWGHTVFMGYLSAAQVNSPKGIYAIRFPPKCHEYIPTSKTPKSITGLVKNIPYRVVQKKVYTFLFANFPKVGRTYIKVIL